MENTCVCLQIQRSFWRTPRVTRQGKDGRHPQSVEYGQSVWELRIFVENPNNSRSGGGKNRWLHDISLFIIIPQSQVTLVHNVHCWELEFDNIWFLKINSDREPKFSRVMSTICFREFIIFSHNFGNNLMQVMLTCPCIEENVRVPLKAVTIGIFSCSFLSLEGVGSLSLCSPFPWSISVQLKPFHNTYKSYRWNYC